MCVFFYYNNVYIKWWYPYTYRMFIEYCVFSLKFCDYPELCHFCCSAGVLPAWCVYTHWHRGKTEKDQSPEYFKIIEKKNTIFNEHLVTYRNLVIRKLFLFPIYIFHHSIGCHLTENTFFFYSSIWMEPRSQIFFWIQQVKNLSA